MRVPLISAIAIAILFFLAAIAKWLYPTHLPFHLDQMASTIEIGAAILLLIFHRRARAWALISVLFSLWLGYTLFWFIQNENCGCFGNVLEISAGITTVINAIAIGLSFWNWGRIEKNPIRTQAFIIIDGLAMIMGFLIAVWVGYPYIKLTAWGL